MHLFRPSLVATVTDAQEEPNTFAGLRFGIGLSATRDLGSRDRVEEAKVVNGIVRVTETNNWPVRILLESHFFFRPNGPLLGIPPDRWGWGPMVAIQPGSGSLIDAYGVGLMLGLRRPDPGNFSSWNFGIGLILDPKTKTLGDGFTANQPPPAGETEVRYTTRAQGGLFIMTSFSW